MIVAENYKVLTDEHIEEFKEFAKNKVRLWHDKVHPDYIFLTETSAIPFGWLFKETWKEMFPGEPVPKFYRINPHRESGFIGRMLDYEKEHGSGRMRAHLEEYLDSRIKDKSANTILFDETDRELTDGKGYDPSGNSLKRVDKNNENSLKNETLEKGRNLLAKYGEIKNLWTDQGMPNKLGNMGEKTYLGDYIRINNKEKEEILFKNGEKSDPSGKTEPISSEQYKKEGLPSKPYGAFRDSERFEEQEIAHGPMYIKPTRKNQTIEGGESINDHLALTGITEKDPELRKRALDYISDLKLAGKEAGIEARQENEKKKSLEQRLFAIIGIIGLGSSVFFLGSSITGNVIGSSNMSSGSLIGSILFFVGILGVFLCFHKEE
jgi:hypothetical protein